MSKHLLDEQSLESLLEENLEAAANVTKHLDRLGSLLQIAARGLPLGSEERDQYLNALKDLEFFEKTSQKVTKKYVNHTYAKTSTRSHSNIFINFGKDKIIA